MVFRWTGMMRLPGYCRGLWLVWRVFVIMLLAGAVLGAAGSADGVAGGWSVVPSPDKEYAPQLAAVSCVSASACAAVGSYQTRAVLPPRSVLGSYTLAESWKGTRWSVVPSPSPGSTANEAAGSDLRGVSCVAASWCAAVGGYQTRDGRYKTLAEWWNGTRWSVVATPDLGPPGGALDGVSCVSARWCVAVGLALTRQNSKTLAESWNGARWSVVTTPPTGPNGGLLAVSCVTSRACAAIGTAAEWWNGTRWSVVPSAHVPGALLDGVSCTAATTCTAVGYDQVEGSKGPTGKTLTESWDGTRWSRLRSPNAGPAASGNYLYGVSCAAADACTAVGQYLDKQQGYKTLIESWNGARWSLMPSPNVLPPATRNELSGGVSCVAAAACTAVGRYFYTKSYRIRTLVESQAPSSSPPPVIEPG